jgi:methionine S-methyltransferase
VKPLGGVSLIARPTAYEGKQINYDNGSGPAETFTLDGVDTIKNAIFSITKLHLQASNIQGYIRFGFSLPEEDYGKAVEALKTFRKMVLAPQ